MPIYESFQSHAAEAPQMRKWVIRALLASIVFHLGLLTYFHSQILENFGSSDVARLAPPVRILKRVSLPQNEAEPAAVKTPETKPKATHFKIPDDKPVMEDVRLSPQIPQTLDLPKQMLNDKPRVDLAESLARAEANSRGTLEKELNSLAGSLIKEGPHSPHQPILNLPTSARPGEGGIGDAAGIPGRQSLDDALSRTGPLPVGDKPIGLPGGALYDYDRADLRPEAMEELLKLAELIRRNPHATFSIEGHTDSSGDALYNEQLSLRRAESVKAWLVQNLKIPPERIQTRGFGSRQLIVPSDRSIEEQQPNRRVEIVIKTNRK